MTDQLSIVFSALADPTRRGILTRLSKGAATVTDLAEPFAMSMPAISKHLKVLERAGLVSRSREAQWRPVRIDAAPLETATAWMEQYRTLWDDRFDALENHLAHLVTSNTRTTTSPTKNTDKENPS